MRPTAGAKTVRVSSPDGRIVFSLRNADSQMQYSIDYDKKTLVRFSPIGIELDNGSILGKDVILGKERQSNEVEDYELPVGKTSHVHEVYRQAIVPLIQKGQKTAFAQLYIKVFNDGAAFRYVLNCK